MDELYIPVAICAKEQAKDLIAEEFSEFFKLGRLVKCSPGVDGEGGVRDGGLLRCDTELDETHRSDFLVGGQIGVGRTSAGGGS